jgi:hypothetical protein
LFQGLTTFDPANWLEQAVKSSIGIHANSRLPVECYRLLHFGYTISGAVRVFMGFGDGVTVHTLKALRGCGLMHITQGTGE